MARSSLPPRPPFFTWLEQAVHECGGTIEWEKQWRLSGQIVFKNGTRSSFYYNVLDVNPSGAGRLARDKDYAAATLAQLGYPVVPRSRAFYSPSWAKEVGVPEQSIDAAYEYARLLGWPVYVKPNGATQGNGVSLVYTKKEFEKAVRLALRYDRVFLVQPPIAGRDYRMVVFGDKLIAAYERIPLSVTGDGVGTIAALLARCLARWRKVKRSVSLQPEDVRIDRTLQRQGMTRLSIPGRGQRVPLLASANLSTGGEAVNVTSTVHPKLASYIVTMVRDFGLNLAGVDVIMSDDVSVWPQTHVVLEINSAPGFSHFASLGQTETATIANLYREMIKMLAGRIR